MKGTTSIELNQATMIEAVQQYFDAQFKKAHVVKSVKRAGTTNGGYGGTAEAFEVEFEDKPEDAS